MTARNLPVPRITQRISECLGQSLREVSIATLDAAWNDRWKPRLRELSAEASRVPTVTIAVVGGTGAGKSTLLNALLGERILPVSNSRACTAAISEVSFADSEFAADIEFVSRNEWRREMSLLLADVADEKQLDMPATSGGDGVAKAARDRLKAVYQIPDEDIRPGLKLEELQEPPNIKDVLDAGKVRIANQCSDEFRKQLRVYLDSKHEFWPLVKTARISGPFPGLTTRGIKLVDLPGLNDPNEAREQVTRNYLKECRFVWIVFNIKRALTRDIQTIMQSDDFARQIVLDGRENALTFVGTHSDEVDRESGIEEFSLSEDATESEIVASRNSAVRTVIADQLHELAGRLAQSAGDQARTEELSTRLRKSRVFTVSARDYLHLRGISKNRSSTLEDTGETEIPSLREHLATISAAYTEGAHQESLLRQVNLLLAEIKHRIQTEIQNVSHARELTTKKRKEIRNALQRLLTFLSRDLKSHCEGFVQEMNAKHELLDERLKRAFERGRSELERVTESWGRIHWATLRAIVRRNGRYHSPTSGQYDFADDISRPALEMITFAWDDFFGDKMTHALTVWSDKLMVLAERHGNETVREVIQQVGAESTNISDDLQRSLEVNERLIKEYVGQTQSDMSGKLHTVRTSLYDQIPRQVAANMREAYVEAEDESGTGMKQRILELLSSHARRVSKVMFDDSRDRIMEGVRMVTDSMSRRYNEMADGVSERLAVPVANFVQEDDLSPDADEAVASLLPTVLSQLDELMGMEAHAQ